jgi:hypothetical protein
MRHDILRQGHEQDGRRHRLAPQSVRETFAIPALVELTQRVDEGCAEAQPFGQPLCDFAVPAELLLHELGQAEHAAHQGARHVQGRCAGVGLAHETNRHIVIAASDIDAAMAYLKAQPGVTVFERSVWNFVYFTTPWGMMLQIVRPLGASDTAVSES